MRKYLVVFDRTDHGDHDYTSFTNILKKLNGVSFYNVWLIESDIPHDTLFRELYGLIAKEDRLVICELASYCSRRVNMPSEESLKVI